MIPAKAVTNGDLVIAKTINKVMLAGIAAIGVLGTSVSTGQEISRQPAYVQRAESRAEGDLRVSTAALSADESEALYKAPLADRLIQPVWIEVENSSSKADK